MSDTNSPQITEIYKGRLIEVYRTELDEEDCDGGEWWMSDYINLEGKRISEAELERSPEECLESTRAVIDWGIEQNEMLNKIKELFSQFQAKGYTQAGIMEALTNALSDTLDESDWKKKVIRVLEDAAILAWMPGRVLP